MLRTFALATLSLLLLLQGCSNEAPPEPLRLLGGPPSEAFVGVEYSYEVGVDGGDGPYEYTLTNNPAWMTLEYNDNPLRPGIVLRGVPGLTGGQATDDPLVRVYTDIQLTVTDGSRITSQTLGIAVKDSLLRFLDTEVQEAEQTERPKRAVFNPETRLDDLVDIPLCMTNDEGDTVVTEEDLSYWLGLIDYLEAEEAGEVLNDDQRQELQTAFGDFRPRIAYLPLNLGDGAIVADTLFRYEYLVDDTTVDLVPEEDYMTSVRRQNGEVLTLDSGYLNLLAGEDTCPLLIFVNDDRVAEDRANSLPIQLTKISEHDYIAPELQGRLDITDNEPIANYKFERGSVTQSDEQLGYDDENQPPGTIYRLTVSLVDVPLQDQTEDHMATARLVLLGTESTATFGTVSGPEEVPAAAEDIVADTRPDYVDAVPAEPAIDIHFQWEEDPDAEEGEESERWISERVVYFYAPENLEEEPEMRIDDVGVFGWERTETVRYDDNQHAVFVNEWSDSFLYSFSPDGKVMDVESGFEGGLYLAYSDVEDGITRSYFDYFDRKGNRVIQVPINFGPAEVRIRDVVVREDVGESGPGGLIQEVLVTGVVDVLAAPPLFPGDTSSLGGDDILVAFYRRVNEVGDFELIWSRQIGSIWDDKAGEAVLTNDEKFYVTGSAGGDFSGYANAGGYDGLVALFDRDGAPQEYRLYGTAGDEFFNAAALDGTLNLFTMGSTSSETELGASGGGLDYLSMAFSQDMSLRRRNQFGRERDEIGLAASNMARGYFVGGTTTGSFFLDPPNRGMRDVFLAYQRTASAIDSLLMIGSPGEDVVAAVDSIDYFGVAGGYTEGTLFSGFEPQGGKDWWMASYDVKDVNSNRVVTPRWELQGETADDEAIKAMSLTTFGKLHRVIQREVDGQHQAIIEPAGITDGRLMSVRPE